LLRVDRLLKRAEWSRANARPGLAPKNVYQFGPNTIDFATGSAECRQGKVELTEQELKLLRIFVANAGRPLSRAVLLEVGWGYTRKVTSRTVDNFIVRLRRYFEDDPGKPKYFKSIRSVGYIFDPDSSP
jgi:DNA-binding response OmpR family regulator